MSPDLARWLGYLHDLGWEDLYLPRHERHQVSPPREGAAAREASPSSSDAPRAAPSHSSHPPSSPKEPRPARVQKAAGAQDPGSGAPRLDGPVPEDPTDRAAHLVELGRYCATCERCRLAEGRNRVVFGSGAPHADLMFIGEGPGAQEDRQGLPFVGPAGELLTRILKAIEMTRDEVYIANIVKCRPPGNRDPRPDEVAACRGYLERQIDLIRPKVIVALGRVAAQTLLGNDLALGKMRGEWWLYHGVELRVTYHPAALLRNAGLKRPTWEDMQVVRDRVRELAEG